MLGYIVSDRSKINIKENEIFSFDILHKTNLNIFVVENNKVLYKKNNIIYYACYFGHVEVLKWFKNSGYEFKYNKWSIHDASIHRRIKVLEWLKNYCNIKKIIKISKCNYNKTIKYKTKNNYINGYNKN